MSKQTTEEERIERREIQRYILKDKSRGEIFAQNPKTLYSIRFRWFLTEGKVGIQPVGGGGHFFKDFLVTDEKLFVRRKHSQLVSPLIARVENYPEDVDRTNYITYSPKQGHMEPLEKIVDLLLSEDQVHCYLSHEPDGRYLDILTFSLTSPSSELYAPGKLMQRVELKYNIS